MADSKSHESRSSSSLPKKQQRKPHAEKSKTELSRGLEDRSEIFTRTGRPAYIHVDLDAISNNITILRQSAENPNIAIVAMVKGNGYGHGAVPVALHLKSLGVERLGVATTEEGFQLRQAGITGPIHVFGNVQGWEMKDCVQYDLIATISTKDVIKALGNAIAEHKREESNGNEIRNGRTNVGTVHIKLDTGMSRNGCNPEELPDIIKLCEEEQVPLEGILTHMADYVNEEFTKMQMDVFYEAIKPYRDSGLLFHTANSGSILSGIGTELDMMRPGIAIYGLSPGEDVDIFTSLGFRPAASVYGQASLVKRLPSGRSIGYGCTYKCETETWVVTIPVGYADFYWRHLSNRGVVIRERTGERCPVIGRVSMDAITVKVTAEPAVGESFALLTADFDQETSATGISTMLWTIPDEETVYHKIRKIQPIFIRNTAADLRCTNLVYQLAQGSMGLLSDCLHRFTIGASQTIHTKITTPSKSLSESLRLDSGCQEQSKCQGKGTKGECCPVIGRVPMDDKMGRATVEPAVGESFALLTADFDEETSATGISTMLGTITYEVATRFQERLPRHYTADNRRSLLSMTRQLKSV